jgi:uncharacterized protein (DUF2267 family)
MVVPAQYMDASLKFDRLLAAAREAAGLVSKNQAYTMLEGVLLAFRRRLTAAQVLVFADVLPPVARAVLVAGWHEEPPLPFGDREAMTLEAQSLRPGHNFAPDTCIHDVAIAIRKHVDEAAFDAVVAALPEGAVQFWAA